jgi:hypothetical protein
MFKKIAGLVALVAALSPGMAHAGFGATANLGGLSDGTSWAPSLDWRAKGYLFQLQLVDTIGGATSDRLDIGAGFSGVAAKRKIAGEIEGVMMPGGRLRYFQYIGDTGDAIGKSKLQGSGFNVVGEFRMGMELKEKMGFGVYVVPQLGISNLFGIASVKEDDTEFALTYGGGLEVSAWFLEK